MGEQGAITEREHFVQEQRGAVRRITIDRAAKRNALTPSMQRDLFAAIDDAMSDAGTHVVVLAGAGPSFCSGADLKAGGRPGVTNAPGDMVHNRGRVDDWLRLWSAPKPLIAQVQGYCLGIGNELAACCDLVVCAESARFGMPEAREFALPPTLAFWPLVLGLHRTKELLYTGRLLSGAEAAALGWATACVADDELTARTDALADRIAEVDASILTVTKQAANAWWERMGARAAALGGAEYHAIFHQVSSWEALTGGGSERA